MVPMEKRGYAPAPASTPTTVTSAVAVLALAMAASDDIGRATAKAVFSALADDPGRALELGARLEKALMPMVEIPDTKQSAPDLGARQHRA